MRVWCGVEEGALVLLSLAGEDTNSSRMSLPTGSSR